MTAQTNQIVTDLLRDTFGKRSLDEALNGVDDTIALRVHYLLAEVLDTHRDWLTARTKVATALESAEAPRMLRVGEMTRTVSHYEAALTAHQMAWNRARDVLQVVARLRRQTPVPKGETV